MLKLIRNTLADKKVLLDSDGKLIKWAYIEMLQELQENEGLHIANKLTKKHINYQKQKMKVSLAAQTVSSSVADALQFCRKNILGFEDSEPTEKFIRYVDRIFDITNSKNPFAKNYKAPLKKTNKHLWKPFCSEIAVYLSEIQISPGTKLIESGRKQGVHGFLITLKSLMALFDRLIDSPDAPLRYLLGYKFSQDHLEVFFSAICRKGGFNNNPSAAQSEASYKRLLVHNEMKHSADANCANFDGIDALFSVASSEKSKIFVFDMNLIREELPKQKNKDNHAHFKCEDHNYSFLSLIALSPYCENVVEYVSGFVARNVRKKLKCVTCITALEGKDNFQLIVTKNRGGLITPARDVVVICKTRETILRLFLHNNSTPPSDKIYQQITINCFQMLIEKNFFSNLQEHCFDYLPLDNHVVTLIKIICKEYLKIRLHYLTKQFNRKIHLQSIRKILTKTIFF